MNTSNELIISALASALRNCLVWIGGQSGRYEPDCARQARKALAQVSGRGQSAPAPVVPRAPSVPQPAVLVKPAPPQRRTVSIPQACGIAGVSRRTIYNWLHAGKVQYVRTAGGSVRIFADSLLTPDAPTKPVETDRLRMARMELETSCR